MLLFSFSWYGKQTIWGSNFILSLPLTELNFIFTTFYFFSSFSFCVHIGVLIACQTNCTPHGLILFTVIFGSKIPSLACSHTGHRLYKLAEQTRNARINPGRKIQKYHPGSYRTLQNLAEFGWFIRLLQKKLVLTHRCHSGFIDDGVCFQSVC